MKKTERNQRCPLDIQVEICSEPWDLLVYTGERCPARHRKVRVIIIVWILER